MIVDINLEFDSQGKIKDNYSIKGFLKDGKISLVKKYNIDKLNFIFNLNNKMFLKEKTDRFYMAAFSVYD